MNGFFGQWWRVGGACGVLFVLTFILAGVYQGSTPTYDDPIADIRAYWQDDGDRYLLADYFLGLFVFIFFLPFLCALRGMLGLAEGGAQMWSRVAFTAGVLFVALAGAAASSWSALAFAADNLDDESLRLLMYVDVAAWSGGPFAIGTLLLASSLVIYQTGVLWRWLAILGGIIGVISLIAPLGLLDYESEGSLDLVGFASFLGMAIWLLSTSIGMLTKQSEPLPVVTREM